MREAAFRDAIASGAGVDRQPRFAIYKNNVNAAAVTALAVRYPAVRNVLGQAEFADLCSRYWQQARPTSPVLITHGDDFPAFIASSPESSQRPWLAGVAQLESLWWKAYHAAEAKSLGISDFRQVPPEVLGLATMAFHPSVALMFSPYAVGSLWQAASRQLALPHVEGPQHVLVWRPEAEIEVRILAAPDAAFIRQLIGGCCLADAIAGAMKEHADFDLPANLAFLTSSGLATAINKQGPT